ncbi:hypothetical protein C5167_029099 [Papaver somniferum]|nr:hypothetical protein C5167_029099 [Papaver somniferum]
MINDAKKKFTSFSWWEALGSRHTNHENQGNDGVHVFHNGYNLATRPNRRVSGQQRRRARERAEDETITQVNADVRDHRTGQPQHAENCLERRPTTLNESLVQRRRRNTESEHHAEDHRSREIQVMFTTMYST